jgi:two-component sensor histidine kinase
MSASRLRWNSIGLRLAGILLCSLLPFVASAWYTINQLRQRAIDVSLYNINQRLDMLTSQQKLVIENTRLLLGTLAEIPQVKTSHPQDLGAVFSKLKAKNIYYTALFAFDRHGDILASSQPSGKVNIADRPYFRAAISSGAFSVGEYSLGRVSGQPSLHFAQPVYRTGSLDLSCVLVAGFDLSSYGELFPTVSAKSGETIEAFDRAGLRLYRMPKDPAEPLGVCADEEFLSLAGRIPPETGRILADDHRGNFYGIDAISVTHAGKPDFYVSVHYPKSWLFGGANAASLRGIAILFGSLALSLLLLGLLIRAGIAGQFTIFLRAAMHFGEGDFSVRTGIGKSAVYEIYTLARAFDGMADALAARQAERDQAERELRASLREKEILLKEIHHRVKNNFQIVSSLLSLQAETISDQTALAAFGESQNRIKSMALIHEMLYQSATLSRIDFADYARRLASDVLGGYSDLSKRVEVAVEAEPVALDLDKAVPLGLILNEFLTNAYKHAFPAPREGLITVSLRVDAAGMVCLRVSDNGVGFDFDWKKRKGLGMELIEALSAQLKGAFECDGSAGGRFSVSFFADLPAN